MWIFRYTVPPPPCLYNRACALTVMMIEYTCLHEQQWCVCWWLNLIQSLVKSITHYILATRTVIWRNLYEMASVYLSNAHGLKPFVCPETAGISAPWERWLRAFELFATGKGVKAFICLQIKMFMSPSHAMIYVSLLRGALITSHAFTFNIGNRQERTVSRVQFDTK